MASTIRLSTVNKLLLFTLVAILCYAVLVSGTIGVNPVPTYWASSIDYGRQAIIDTGHIYEPGEDSATHTWQSELRSYGAQDVLPKIFFALINIITGDTTFPGDLVIFSLVPIAGIILIPLTLMAFYTYIAKRQNDFNFLDLLLIFLLSVFPLASMVTPGSSNGTMLGRGFLLLIIFLMVASYNSMRKTLILCFLMAVYFLIYHTWSYYLLIIAVFMLITSLSMKKINIFYVSAYAVVAYFIIGMSLNFYQLIYLPRQSLLNMLSQVFSSTAMVVDHDKQSYISVDPGNLSYTSFTSLFSYMQLANVLLLSLFALSIVLAFLYSLVKRRHISHERSVITLVLLGMPLCLLSLYALGGFKTMELRGMEVMVFVLVLSAAYVLAYSGSMKNKLCANIARVLIVAIVVICVWSYFNQPGVINVSLDDIEYSGISYAGHRIPANESVFSDFRLGATLIYYDMNQIYTVDSTSQIQAGQFNDIMSIYYEDVEPGAILDNLMPGRQYYVLASERQSNVSVVDTSMTSFLKPARKGFEKNFEKGDEFNKVYSSGDFVIYGRAGMFGT